jgi:hypothetical protein
LDDVVTSARTLEIDVDAVQVDEGRLRASPYQAGGVVEGAIVEVFGRPDRLRTP